MTLRSAAPVLLLLATALPLGGCPAALPPSLREATVKPADLPADFDELLRFVEDEAKKETAAAEENVIVAVDHGVGRGFAKDPHAYELFWRGARACAWLTEEFTDKGQRASYAQKGIDYARRATDLEPKRVEAYYYLGINLGQSATTKTVGAYTMVPKVVKAAEAAKKIDERFDHAGPARLLGTVYAKAPQWPASIGDIDKGIEHLSRAVELAPDYPQNHLHYGDALVIDGKLNEAEREYRLVLDAATPPEWAHRAERWHREAEAGLKKIAEKRTDSRRLRCPRGGASATVGQ